MAEIVFKLPGQHVYDGMVFPGHFKAEIMERIKTDASFNFQDEDIILVSYPKAGDVFNNLV